MINENKEILNNPFSNLLEKQYMRENNSVGIKLMQENRIHSLGFYMQPIKYSKKSKKIFSDFYKEKEKYFPLIFQLCQVLTKGEEPIEKQQLIINMMDILIATPILSKNVVVSMMIDNYLRTEIDSYLEKVLKKYVGIMEKKSNIFLRELEKKYFIKSIITFYKPMLRNLLPKVKVIIAINMVQGFCIEQEIIEKIRARYSFWAIVHPISFFEKDSDEIDIYITNSTSKLKELKSVHAIYWEFYPVHEDWNILDREINDHVIKKFEDFFSKHQHFLIYGK